MASKKVSTLCIIASLLIISFTLTNAIRPEPASAGVNPAKIGDGDFDQAEKVEVDEDSCEGVGEEECLMRRTLAAHIDYIYTQKNKP
ncbi:hypothetical protein P3X46_013666 [Hevea brasiliensis]|uniref:Phytosulfokine n=1 Tax=Hevea brasiliensis TaxID=3981 RepID=A0ABQ9M484_HEVBR|nr:phytosulfokines [Hevea brasiliensis]KAJ9175084.1 hypothetical protein P3X46_013666 [Hevea brasiliensis]